MQMRYAEKASRLVTNLLVCGTAKAVMDEYTDVYEEFLRSAL
jgi:hypothetical protein